MTTRTHSDSPEGKSYKRTKLEDVESDGSDSTVEESIGEPAGRPKSISREPSCKLARWCRLKADGTCKVDKKKVKNLLPQGQLRDPLIMQEIMGGAILHAQIHPLIFDNVEPNAPDVVRLRSLPFLEDLANGKIDHQVLELEQQKIIAIGIRDLYLADSYGLLTQDEKDILRGLIRVVQNPVQTLQIGAMDISFHPSKTHSTLRFMEDLNKAVKLRESEPYAQVMETPKLFAVFVNLADLSYHNYENIIPLDSWLEWKTSDVQALDLIMERAEQDQGNQEIFTCKMTGASAKLLQDLSTLDLYANPLNKITRGGERFIFHSSLLSKCLTKAVQSSGVLDLLADGSLNSSFEFVNYVFRCNRFKPGDAKFSTHRDTPYYDRNRSHVSKYTFLIYLSGGHGDPVLKVQDTSLRDIEEMTCVIFDQRYEHMGQPYADGDKVFLRTELIFKDENLRHEDSISALFSEACYMSGQSVVDEELARHADACFELANSQRWAIEKAINKPSVYLHKVFQGVGFLTNGYDYWFKKQGSLNAKDCAILAILDYFNCKVARRAFRSLSTSKTVKEPMTNIQQMWEYLDAHKTTSPPCFRRLQEQDLTALLQDTPKKPFRGQLDNWEGEAWELEEFDEEGSGCCMTHAYPMFNPRDNPEVMEAYETCREHTLGKLRRSPILILDREITLNESRIIISGDKIFILQQNDDSGLPPINFAACWAGTEIPADFIILKDEVQTPKLLLPPMTLYECDEGYQLGLDFFRNDWMVQVDAEAAVPVPGITEDFEGHAPFMDKVTEPRGEIKELLDSWDYRDEI